MNIEHQIKIIKTAARQRQPTTLAAVTTGHGPAAIAVIELFGKNAKSILKKIFHSTTGKTPDFHTGKILVRTIEKQGRIIDQVTVGCENTNHFAINCHGNPLIVSDIMTLLHQTGAKTVTSTILLHKILSFNTTPHDSPRKCKNTIEIEAALALPDAKTLLGTKIIAGQINSGLSKIAPTWLDKFSKTSLKKIKADAKQIFKNTLIAKPLIYGARVVLAGPPNSGKSTLLNFLAGTKKALVSDIAGTTRDYVTAHCTLGPLFVEFIDTAGLDTSIKKNYADKTAQKKTARIINDSHLVLLVLDNSVPENKLDKALLKKISHKPAITVLNKSDKSARFKIQNLPHFPSDVVRISAKTGAGVDKLLAKIRQKINPHDFDLTAAVCTTDRQLILTKKIAEAKSKPLVLRLITQLLNAHLRV
jgi:tRNA modification GTPase